MTMKKSTIISLVILGIMIIPFKIAYLSPSDSNIMNLVSFLVVVFGTLTILSIHAFGGESEGSH